jgi:hypothetical protein
MATGSEYLHESTKSDVLTLNSILFLLGQGRLLVPVLAVGQQSLLTFQNFFGQSSLLFERSVKMPHEVYHCHVGTFNECGDTYIKAATNQKPAEILNEASFFFF